MIEMFIVKKFSLCQVSRIKYESLSGFYYFESELRFVNVLEEPIPKKLFKKLLELDDHIGSKGYYIVERK